MEGQTNVPPVPPAGSVPSAGAVPRPSGPVKRLTYDGKLGELYKIFFVNFLLGLVTLGIYRFWGKTRMRRYLWSHMRYDSDRFEYTGTGGELFRGFLIVAAVLVVIGLGVATVDIALNIVFSADPLVAALASQGITFLLYIVFGYLLMVGQYMALRYRLSRSRWRGIRAALAGSPWKYGISAFAWLLAVGASLGFAKPVADVSLARLRLRNLFFGTAQAKLDADGGTGGLYGPYVGSWFATAAAVMLFYGVFFGMIFANHEMFSRLIVSSSDDPVPVPDLERIFEDPDVQNLLWRMAAVFLLAGIPAWILVLFARSWYAAALFRRIAGMVELAGVQPRSTITTGSLWWLVAGNMLISLLTIGFGQPIVLHRLARFTAARLEIAGEVDGVRIGQSQQAVPGRGEGLLEAFDAGGAF